MKNKLDFQVVDSAAHGYRFVWENRRMCLYLAALPFFIRLGCYAVAILLDIKSDLRVGLIALPSYFAEGYMAGLLVHVLMQAKLMNSEKTSSLKTLKNRVFVHVIGPQEKRIITASMIIYVLIQIVYMLMMSAMKDSMNNPASSILAGETAGQFLFGVVLLAVMLWAVRLAWLNVPVAMGFGIKHYLRTVQPFMSSIYMIGISLLSTVPIGLVVMMILQILQIGFAEIKGGMVFYQLMSGVMQTFAHVAALTIGTAAMTFSLYSVMVRKA